MSSRATLITRMDAFHRLTFRDAFRAGEAMAEAFIESPVWRKLFEGETKLEYKYQAFFEVPVRLCLKYGKVRAISDKLEGIVAYVPGRYSDITFWRLLRIGAIGCGMRMGMAVSRGMADLRNLAADRAQNTGGKPYLYLMLLGVRTTHQGKGLGGSLLRALIVEGDARGVPIYLETETQENVLLYERFGFKLIKQIKLEKLGLPMWEMIREPN